MYCPVALVPAQRNRHRILESNPPGAGVLGNQLTAQDEPRQTVCFPVKKSAYALHAAILRIMLIGAGCVQATVGLRQVRPTHRFHMLGADQC